MLNVDKDNSKKSDESSEQRVSSQRQKNRRLIRKALKDGDLTVDELIKFIRMRRTRIKTE